MHKEAFVFFLVFTLGLLSYGLVFPANITDNSTLMNLEANSRVYLSGFVNRQSGNYIYVDSIAVNCECRENYLGREVYVEGKVEDYLGKKKIRALKISILDPDS